MANTIEKLNNEMQTIKTIACVENEIELNTYNSDFSNWNKSFELGTV